MAFMAPVELLGIAGKKSRHYLAHRDRSCSQKQVDMICHEGPGIAGGRCFGKNLSKSVKKVMKVQIIFENIVSLYPIWCKAPDASMRDFLGIVNIQQTFIQMSLFHERP